jgi:hypothetical protein
MDTIKPISYKPVPADQKPWLKLQGFQQTFFPISWGKLNGYTIFLPGVDRFLITDHYDLWAMVETSKILTSKCSPVVYILNRPTPGEMKNNNCLEYSTRHKKFEPEFGSPLVTRHKQTASLKKIQPDNVIYAGWSEDYDNPAGREILQRLQEYALFTLRCVYAIRLAQECRNFFPEKYYTDMFFKDQFPADFKTVNDLTTSPYGMEHEIKRILYHSDTVDEALASINEAWLKYSLNDINGVRQHFYMILGIIEPENTAIVGKPGEWNINYHDSTVWVL